MTRLPDVVAATCARYLELIDKALPDQVLGLYLTGSVPQGDFHPGVSDIDGVVVLATPLESAEPVRAVHEALPAKPAFDVTYLTAADLAAPPDPEKPVVFTLDGVFKEAVESMPDEQVLDDWIVPWCTLGIPRLHALLATNQFVSKTGAGQHAIATFPSGRLCPSAA